MGSVMDYGGVNAGPKGRIMINGKGSGREKRTDKQTERVKREVRKREKRLERK